MMTEPITLQAPFPWFGGKRKVASIVWDAIGNAPNYVEPFAGSLAVLLQRPHVGKTETVNDLDGMVANVWRALATEPEAVAAHCDWIIHECELHARHAWLVSQRESITSRLEGNPTWCDPKIAGWWLYGVALWIGSGWCSGQGPWHVIDGELVNVRQLPHLGNAGQGVNRQLPHLGNAGRGVNRQLPHLGNAGQGVNRKLPHLGNAGQGVNRKRRESMEAYFSEFQQRLDGVRICCGDWSRVTGPSVTTKHGLTGVFLDPPYGTEAARADLYAMESHTVAHDVRAWCIEHGNDPLLRIVLAGYDGEHNELESLGWRVVHWNAGQGFGGQAAERTENGRRERLWMSPHCITDEPLLAMMQGGNDDA